MYRYLLQSLTENADTAGSADDMSQATAILNGLQAANRPADNPAYWIHISGTAILQWVSKQTPFPSPLPRPPNTSSPLIC